MERQYKLAHLLLFDKGVVATLGSFTDLVTLHIPKSFSPGQLHSVVVIHCKDYQFFIICQSAVTSFIRLALFFLPALAPFF